MYKSKLQELCHQNAWSLQEYVTVKDGPDHNPRFISSITVNGVSFETPPNQFRSSKEAQNQAAKLAFDHFTAAKLIVQHSINPNPRISSSPSGFLTSTANLDIRAAKSGIVEPIKQENAQNLLAGETPLGFKDDKSCKDMLHLYKNRLQNYAQKRNLTLPTYSCETVGPPHASYFKSKVTVDGKSYETSNFFTILNEAEHAAAKVAFDSLSLEEIQEDEGLYKSLLQELAQKEGSHFPTYETAKSGPPHLPTFLSTVKIGGESYQGHEAKTKKLAEMNAAKVAYTSLIERQARWYSTVSSPGVHIKEALEVSSFNLQPNVTDKVQPNVTEQVEPKVVLETNSSIQEEQADKVKETDINAERHRCSFESENVYAQLQDPFSSTLSPPKDGATNIVESDIKISAGAHSSAIKKVLVCPRKPNMTNPDGATVEPISDDKWVAMTVDIN